MPHKLRDDYLRRDQEFRGKHIVVIDGEKHEVNLEKGDAAQYVNQTGRSTAVESKDIRHIKFEAGNPPVMEIQLNNV